MSKFIIELSNLRKSYDGQVHAVDGLSLGLAEGEILALLGPSGCGKTTTLRLIAGFERPDQGSIKLGGRVVANDGVWIPPEHRGVGMVFQDYALFPHLTVEANVGFGLVSQPHARRKQRAREMLELVGLAGLESRYPHELSGGQQQRVALARALAHSPVVVLLDEPFSNLDADMRAQVRGEVQSILRKTGSTSVFVTHDQEEAMDIADRVAVLNHGRLEQLNTPEAVYHTPATRFVADFVGQADFLPGTVRAEGIDTEIGFMEGETNLSEGTEVDVMVRPDDLDIVPSPQGTAVVAKRQFRGATNLYTLHLPSGVVLHSSQPSRAIFGEGAHVLINSSLLSHLVAFPRHGPGPQHIRELADQIGVP
ncbi:MAG: ABC transporter ATP-binding protein [Chloroflexota bacterium]|nr:MAG: ABC transporter ATP-binding protein [Chloroflexota bacterium]